MTQLPFIVAFYVESSARASWACVFLIYSFIHHYLPTMPAVIPAGSPLGGELRMQKLRSLLLRTQSSQNLCLKHGVGQNIATHASPAARDSAFPSSAFQFIQLDFSAYPHQTCRGMWHEQRIRLLLLIGVFHSGVSITVDWTLIVKNRSVSRVFIFISKCWNQTCVDELLQVDHCWTWSQRRRSHRQLHCIESRVKSTSLLMAQSLHDPRGLGKE